MGKTINKYKIFVENPEWKRSLRRHVSGRIILKWNSRIYLWV
jgi:hypothetical protein